jgi:PP-loop superfamily ATP-utilizing enzyme
MHIAHRLLDLGFDRVTLDLGGYRRGSQLNGKEPDLELLAGSG